MSKHIICKALVEHFGHRNWTLIGLDKVQLDNSDEILIVADLGIDAKSATIKISSELSS